MKSKPFGIYSLIFAIVPLVLLLFFSLFAFMPAVLMIFGGLALIFGIVGIILGKKESNKSTIIMSIIGVVISLLPLIIGLFLAPLLKAL